MAIACKVGTKGCACSDLGKKLLGVIENSLQAGGVVNLIYIAGLDEFTYAADSLLIIFCAFGKTPQLMSAKFKRRRLNNVAFAFVQ